MTLQAINRRLQELEQQLQQLQQQELQAEKLEAELAQARREEQQAQQVLQEAARAVKRLEGFSFSSLASGVAGKRQEELAAARRAWRMAQGKQEMAARDVAQLEEAWERVRVDSQQKAALKVEHDWVLRDKEAWLREQADEATRQQLAALDQQLSELAGQRRELQEAVVAGEEVMARLEDVLKALNSAANWGVWDIFGGGLVATAVKHSRMDEARNHLRRAQKACRSFARELRDVKAQLDIDLRIDSFLTFADFFFDGLLADWMVQAKINDLARAVEQQQKSIQHLMRKLKARLRWNEQDEEKVQQEREALLRSY